MYPPSTTPQSTPSSLYLQKSSPLRPDTPSPLSPHTHTSSAPTYTHPSAPSPSPCTHLEHGVLLTVDQYSLDVLTQRFKLLLGAAEEGHRHGRIHRSDPHKAWLVAVVAPVGLPLRLGVLQTERGGFESGRGRSFAKGIQSGRLAAVRFVLDWEQQRTVNLFKNISCYRL